jgi:hypothetical protein
LSSAESAAAKMVSDKAMFKQRYIWFFLLSVDVERAPPPGSLISPLFRLFFFVPNTHDGVDGGSATSLGVFHLPR